MKVCIKCSTEKPYSEFNKHPRTRDKVSNKCRACESQINKKYYKNNRGKLLTNSLKYQEENKEERSNYKKEWYKKNKERILNKRKDYYIENQERIKDRSRDWYKACDKDDLRTKANARRNKRRSEDLDYKIRENLRCRLKMAVKNKAKGGSAVRDLGCSIEYFIKYIEDQFLEGMSWDNWAYDTWHLDHRIALATFDLTDRVQFLKACHYTNLQPMWGTDNIRKGHRKK